MALIQKNSQLRVRIDERTQNRLAELALARKDGATVSDVVRTAIEQFLTQRTKDCPLSNLNEETMKKLLGLARDLDRDPVQVVEDCIEGIHFMINSDELPLISMELKLRRYYNDRKACVSMPDNESATKLREQHQPAKA